MSEAPSKFDETTLLDEARARSGLVDFGDEGFREPLRLLLRSFADARLNAVGTLVLRTSIRRSLMQRLRARHWLERHPEIAQERIHAPVVVLGMMRSGTTLIQRLLSRDPRFYSALGWEIAEPAPRPDTRWDLPDPRIADGEARAKQMREFTPQLYAIHPTDAHEADEEIVLLADAFLSHIPEASCDVPVYRAWLDTQDFTPAYRYLLQMLQLLQWQKRKRGESRQRWVLKSPAHLGYLDTLFRVFPDAHVVFMHRTPVETVASGASLNATLWKLYADEVDLDRVGRQWLERMAWSTRRALAARERLPEGCFTDLRYADAVANPLGAIDEIYAAIGLERSPAARVAMSDWLEAQRREKPAAHRYAPEDFGLSEAAIRERFREYMARFLDG